MIGSIDWQEGIEEDRATLTIISIDPVAKTFVAEVFMAESGTNATGRYSFSHLQNGVKPVVG